MVIQAQEIMEAEAVEALQVTAQTQLQLLAEQVGLVVVVVVLTKEVQVVLVATESFTFFTDIIITRSKQ
jgi:hypothetical protein